MIYRPVGGELVETTLERVSVEELMAAGPVREFRWYKGRTFYSGWYWSATTGGMVAYESRLELARILLADFDSSVCGMVAQPFRIQEQTGSGLRRHVPDLLLRHHDGRVTVVDVKPGRRLADPLVRQVFGWTAELAGLRGWDFETWSGADAVLLDNVRFLAGYRRPWLIDASLVEPILESVGAQGVIGEIEQVMAGVAPAERARPVLLHLLWSGVLRTDLSRPLGSASPIWRTEKR
ncbi:TnsA-like heteromeric transposase endonuclease subunit [Plantactinospora sp. B6F1]|uniref:TnsA-like heteromeric transposase endonuclease subunit n=1 Tax=Plantactinospora sp. B6F1 TaxID=3158971 RepID=UPI00102D1BAB